ncbi:hypothetical protein OHA21_23480 [Actinoplanes sp. NBC_00393]|uniref:hypothetical protein n=1 Tax=Actinoplanes sp. NBC_00393 TaxID=2975953 RepID=UPI002E1B7EE3
MRGVTALTGALLAGAAVSTAWQAPAFADQPGFSVAVDAPDEFTAAGQAKTITAVVTSQNRQCRKVRWALLVHSGIDPGQLKVTRVEEEREFRVQTRTEGDTTQFVDEALDPGVLCRGRTVTGRWQVEFDGPAGGAVQFEAQAFDVRDRLLSTGGAAAEVEGDEEAQPVPSEEATAEPPAAGAEAGPPADTPAAPEAEQAGDTALASQESSLLGPGLIVGGVFVFLGVLLLARLRARAREARRRAQALPTGFYTMPGAPR